MILKDNQIQTLNSLYKGRDCISFCRLVMENLFIQTPVVVSTEEIGHSSTINRTRRFTIELLDAR